MNVIAKTMWRTMAEMVGERGGTAECISDANGFRVQVYGGKRPFAFVVVYQRLEREEYRKVLAEFRDLVRRELGSTALELRLEREEAQAELGKQKTPFRPGRRRVRFVSYKKTGRQHLGRHGWINEIAPAHWSGT